MPTKMVLRTCLLPSTSTDPGKGVEVEAELAVKTTFRIQLTSISTVSVVDEGVPLLST